MSTAQPKRNLLFLLIAVFCLFVAVISMAGYGFYQTEKRRLIREEIEAIQSVANLKVAQIENWRQERMADAQVTANSPFLLEHLKHLLKFPEEMPCRAGFLKWLNTLRDRYRYDNILLLNGRGEILLQTLKDQEELGPGGRKLIADVIERPRVLFSDFYRNPGAKTTRLSLLAPIVEHRDGKTVVLGILFFRLDPGEFLFPLIKSWPTDSPSAETLLIRREGEEVVYLNELRHRKDTLLSLRFPIEKSDLPSAQAVLGKEGIVWGKDYRGVPVLAVIRRIVDSPWILVSKVDETEIFTELQNYALLFGSLGLGLSLIFGLLCIMLWRRQETHYLRGLALQEAEQKKQLDDILSATPDQIYLMDREGRCLFANRAAVQALGLDYPELLGRNLRDRGLPAGIGELLTSTVGSVSTSGETRGGEISLALAGENRYFDYILTPLLGGAGTQTAVLATFRDITDRKEAEDKLSCLNHLYAALSRADDVLVKERQPQKLQEEFCRIAVEEGGLRFAWVGRVEPESEKIEPVASWGAEEEYLQALSLSTAVDPTSPCPTGTAIREGNIGLYQDLESYARAARWQREGVARGYRSLAVFPLKIGESVVGAMSYFSALPHFFTSDKVQLLERLTSHLALALEMAAREEERQKAEKALRHTKEFFDSILQHAPAPMYVTYRDGSYLLVNPAWETVCHKNREEALGRTAADVFLPDTAQRFMESDQRVLQDARPINYEESFNLRGNRCHFQTIKFPLHNAQGEVEAVGGISIDITERRQAEEALRRSEERYRGIFHNAPIGMFQSTLEGRYLHINPAMAELLGYDSPQEVLEGVQSIAHDVYVHPEQRVDILRRLQAGEEVVKSEILFRRRDGEVRTAHSYFRVIREQGRPVTLEGFVEDITERKKAEENLLIEKQFSDTAIDSLPGLFYLFDDQGTMLRWNQNFQEVSGYAADEISGMKPQDFFRGQEKMEVQKAIEVTMARGEHFIRAEFVTKDGRPIPHFFTGRRALIGGRPCLLGTGIDITELRQAEKALALHSLRLKALLDLHLLADAPEEQLLDFALDATLSSTQSEIAFIGLLDETESVMTIHRWSESAMQQCVMTEKPLLYPVTAAGVWADCIRRRQAVLINDYHAPHPGKKGLPEGHVPIRRFVAVPVFDGSRVVAVAAVANKATDYTPEDVSAFTSLLNKLWEILRHRQMEEALRESEQEYRLLVTNIPAVVARGYNDWSVDVFDEKIEALTGYPLETFNSRQLKWRDLILPEDLPLAKNIFLAAFKTRTPYVREYRIRTRQGDIRWLQERSQMIFDDQGALRYVSGVLFDITARKGAQEALRESEESLRQVLEVLPIGVWVTDQSGVIVQANPAGRSIWNGVKFVGIEGYGEYKAWWRSTGEPIKAEDWAVARALRKGETSLNEVIDIETFDGARKVILNSALPLKNARGEVIKAIAVNQDISERIAFEEKLKASLQEKDVLLKEIHHRVKNNMQIISSLLRLQSDQVRQPEVQVVFQESQNRIRSMALVHEMLYQSPDLASISFGTYLKDLVNGLFRSFRVDTHQIALTLEVEDISLVVDLALSCGLIINELVSNTLKHAFPQNRQGGLSISARQVSPEELLITVRDTGVGLPADLDFRNAPSLGLRLVTLLAGQINGSVELDNAVGTAFLIRVPVKEHHG